MTQEKRKKIFALYVLSNTKTEPKQMPNFPNPKKKICLWCDEFDENLKLCGKCKSAGYCSQSCQISHWPTHKLLCQKQNSEKKEVDISRVIQAIEKIGKNGFEKLPVIFSHRIVKKEENQYGESVITFSDEKYDDLDIGAFDTTAKSKGDSAKIFERILWHTKFADFPKILCNALFVWLKYNNFDLKIDGKKVISIKLKKAIVPRKYIWQYQFANMKEKIDDENDEEFHSWICFKTQGYNENPSENHYFWDTSSKKYGNFDLENLPIFGLSSQFRKVSKIYTDTTVEKDKFDLVLFYNRMTEFFEKTNYAEPDIIKNYKEIFFDCLDCFYSQFEGTNIKILNNQQ